MSKEGVVQTEARVGNKRLRSNSWLQAKVRPAVTPGATAGMHYSSGTSVSVNQVRLRWLGDAVDGRNDIAEGMDAPIIQAWVLASLW